MEVYFSKGNRKLSKEIAIFNLPSGNPKICIGAKECLKVCYARKAQKLYKSVLPRRTENYLLSLKEEFVQEVIKKLRKMKVKYVRIHESGDFYSQEYLDKWIKITESLPEITFLAYTKSHILDFSKVPNNFIVIHSLNSKWDNLITEKDNRAIIIFKGENEKEYKKKGWKICIPRKNKCLINCSYCYRRTGLKQVAFPQH